MRALALIRDGCEPANAPSWDDVARAIHALDGEGKTLVCLALGRGPVLLVGGGNNGRYLVNYVADTETQENYVLIDPSLEGADVELCAGGQTAPYPSNWCISLSLALAACNHFINTGGMAPHLHWLTG